MSDSDNIRCSIFKLNSYLNFLIPPKTDLLLLDREEEGLLFENEVA